MTTTDTNELRLIAAHSLRCQGYSDDAGTVERAADELDALRALLREAGERIGHDCGDWPWHAPPAECLTCRIAAALSATPAEPEGEAITAPRGFYRCDSCGLKRLLDRDVGVCDGCRTFTDPVPATPAEDGETSDDEGWDGLLAAAEGGETGSEEARPDCDTDKERRLLATALASGRAPISTFRANMYLDEIDLLRAERDDLRAERDAVQGQLRGWLERGDVIGALQALDRLAKLSRTIVPVPAPAGGIPDYAMLDLWMALGGEPAEYDMWAAEPKMYPAERWSFLLAAVRGVRRLAAAAPAEGRGEVVPFGFGGVVTTADLRRLGDDMNEAAKGMLYAAATTIEAVAAAPAVPGDEDERGTSIATYPCKVQRAGSGTCTWPTCGCGDA